MTGYFVGARSPRGRGFSWISIAWACALRRQGAATEKTGAGASLTLLRALRPWPETNPICLTAGPRLLPHREAGYWPRTRYTGQVEELGIYRAISRLGIYTGHIYFHLHGSEDTCCY